METVDGEDAVRGEVRDATEVREDGKESRKEEEEARPRREAVPQELRRHPLPLRSSNGATFRVLKMTRDG